MVITLEQRETTASTAETGVAKDLFKGLNYILNNKAGKRPSVTFFDDKGGSKTVTVEEALVEPVRQGKITINHLLGFTIIKADNDGLYFLAPKARAAGSVDATDIIELNALTYFDLLDAI